MDTGLRALTDYSPGRKANIVAVSVISVSLLMLAILGPIARRPVQQIDAFIPAYEAALAITDLITVFLLFGQFVREKSASLLILCCGYLFNTLTIICQALTWGFGTKWPSWCRPADRGMALLVLAWRLRSERSRLRCFIAAGPGLSFHKHRTGKLSCCRRHHYVGSWRDDVVHYRARTSADNHGWSA
jgi:hypothetical protein